MATSPNIRRRYTSAGHVNIEPRYDEVVEQPPADTYALAISISPSQSTVDTASLVSFYATKNGLPAADVHIDLTSDNSEVADVPATVAAGSDGRATFNVIAKAAGAAVLRGSFVMDGVLTYSPPGTLTVAAITPPVNYQMTGWGKLVGTLETPLANMLIAQPERMSHQEQLRQFGDDMGLEYASGLENQTVVFLPKVLTE